MPGCITKHRRLNDLYNKTTHDLNRGLFFKKGIRIISPSSSAAHAVPLRFVILHNKYRAAIPQH